MNIKFLICVFAVLLASASASILDMERAETIEGLARRGLLSGSGGGYVNTESVTASQSVSCDGQNDCDITYAFDAGYESNKLYWYASNCAVGSSPACVEISAFDIVDGAGSEANGVCTSSPCSMGGLDANTEYFFYTVSSDTTQSYPDDAGEYAGSGTTWNVAPEVTSLTLTDTPATGSSTSFDATLSLDGTIYYTSVRKCCDTTRGNCGPREKKCPDTYPINYALLNPNYQSGQNEPAVAGANSYTDVTLNVHRVEVDYYFCYYACDSNGQCGGKNCIEYFIPVAPTVVSVSAVATADGAVVSVVVDPEDTVVVTVDGYGTFTSDSSYTITGEAEKTEITIDVFATNDVGDSDTVSATFTTLDETPPVATVTVGEIAQTTAVVSVTSDEEATVYYIIAEASVDVGVTEITDEGSVFDTVNQAYSFIVTDLVEGTDYTVHAIVCDESSNCGDVTEIDFATVPVPANTAVYDGDASQDVDGAYLIAFNIPVVASTIIGAALALPVSVGTDGSTFSVYRVTEAWNPTTADAQCAAYLDGACATDADWDILNQDGSKNTASATGSYDVTSGWVIFDVTDDVKDFATGDDNYGWVVVTDSGDATFVAAGTTGVAPELRISYPDGDDTDIGIGPVCEHQNAELSCSGGNVIQVTSFVYGRSTQAVCRHRHMSNVNCAATNSMTIASQKCNGKTSCVVPAKNNVFGDPCWMTFKYIEGRYLCVAPNDIENFCGQVDCNNGECVNSVNGATCLCEEGWEGDNCDSEIQPDGDLVLHWNFNDETATDLSGNGNDGKIKGGASATGVDGRALALGVGTANGYVEAEDSETLRLTGDWTVAMFVSPLEENFLNTPKDKNMPTQTVNEWQTMNLECENGNINVKYAKYGRNSWCAASSSLPKVSAECNGRKACSIRARNDVFGDPCWGTFKNLIVQYVCVLPMNGAFVATAGTSPNNGNTWQNSFAIFDYTDAKWGSPDRTTAVIERANGRQRIPIASQMIQDQWNFVAISFSQDVQTFYMNGEAVSQELTWGPSDISTGGFKIGNNNDNDAWQFSGYYDEVKIFNYALSPKQISELRAPYVGVGGPLPIPDIVIDPEPPVSTDPNGGTGCADGTREGFVDEDDIAACAGGWSVPGLVDLKTKEPQCNRKAGNDGSELSGCSAADICSTGFHVCENAAEVKAKTASKQGCTDTSAWDNGFYATRQSGPGWRRCSGTGQNDVFGCGSEGDPIIVNCGGLNRFSHNHCNRLRNGWSCMTHDRRGLTESDTVTHSSNIGGVLCCRDDVSTNSIPKKDDKAERLAIYATEEINDIVIERMRAAVAHFAVCGGKGSKSGQTHKSRCGFTWNKSTGGHTKKTGGTRRTKANVSIKGCFKHRSQSNQGRSLLQDDSRTVIVFDIKGTKGTTALEAAQAIALQAADPSSEYLQEFDMVSGSSPMVTCANGDSSTSCTNKAAREQVELEGEGDSYAIQGSELSNENPVVIGLISTIAVLVVLTLVGFAYRYRNQEKQSSFDGRVMEEEVSSDRVEMDVVPSASHAAASNKQGEQETYWVFNRGAAESSDANVRVLV